MADPRRPDADTEKRPEELSGAYDRATTENKDPGGAHGKGFTADPLEKPLPEEAETFPVQPPPETPDS